MPNLDAFFGSGASKKRAKRASSMKEGSASKRQKPEQSPYFSNRSQKKEIETINLDSSDTSLIVIDDDEEVLPKKPKKVTPVKSSPVSSPKKAVRKSPKKAPRKSAKKETTGKSAGSSGASAADIIKTLPDADESLLKVDPEAAGMNYFQLKAKQQQDGPTEGVDREIPQASPNCLNGLTIVFTGVLPSLSRDECERVASQYGAKVTKSISGRTSLVVIGRDAGPKKVKLIKQKKVKCIDEDGFIQLLEKMPVNGGSGEAAQKELAKKQKELDRAIQEAEEEEQKEKQRQKKARASRPASATASAPPVKEQVPASAQLWTVKHAPTELKQICGNKSNVEMLNKWLEHWFDTPHDGKFSKGAAIDNFPAVLISGPPGTGKTTAANLVARKLGYDVIERNASDFRSKKLLNQGLKVCLDNTSVAGYFHGDAPSSSTNDKRLVLIMDEIDGMSSGDNGGAGQLAQFCRITITPMILICNDKSLPKMRVFDRVCFNMTWRRPTAREMRSRMMTIAYREGLKLDANVIDELVAATHNDIRQIINIMSTVSRTQKTLNFSDTKNIKESWQKEVSLKPFDVIGTLLGSGTYGDNSRYNLNDKIGLFFNDADMMPLMMHENYRITQPAALFNHHPKEQNLAHLELLSQASDSISESDLVNQQIRGGDQQWSLLPFYGVTSTIIPGSKICGRITNRVMFTSWLGQNSKSMKYKRVVQQLQYHSSTKTLTNNQELRLSYVPYLKELLTKPLIEKGADGIDDVLKVMDEYYLTKEDWDNIMELGVGRHGQMAAKLKQIPTRVKTQFTRKYNSYSHPTMIYNTGGIKMGRQKKVSYDDVIDDDAKREEAEEDAEDQENEKAESNLRAAGLVKAVKPKKKSGSKTKRR